MAREKKDKVLKAVRVNPETWQKALGKARARGMTMEQLIDNLLMNYTKTNLDLTALHDLHKACKKARWWITDTFPDDEEGRPRELVNQIDKALSKAESKEVK